MYIYCIYGRMYKWKSLGFLLPKLGRCSTTGQLWRQRSGTADELQALRDNASCRIESRVIRDQEVSRMTSCTKSMKKRSFFWWRCYGSMTWNKGKGLATIQESQTKQETNHKKTSKHEFCSGKLVSPDGRGGQGIGNYKPNSWQGGKGYCCHPQVTASRRVMPQQGISIRLWDLPAFGQWISMDPVPRQGYKRCGQALFAASYRTHELISCVGLKNARSCYRTSPKHSPVSDQIRRIRL